MKQLVLEMISDDEYERIEAERVGQQQLFAYSYHDEDLPMEFRSELANKLHTQDTYTKHR